MRALSCSSRSLSIALSILLVASPTLAADVSVVDLAGQAQWREASDKPWKDLKKSQAVAAGSDVLTGEDARVELVFPGKQSSVVRIGPDSLARVVSVDPANIRINQGKIFALVRGLKKGSTFQISSPTAIASARGTGWTQTPDRVEVFEDTVGLKGVGGEELEVGEGFGVDVGPDGDLGEVFALDDDNREQFDKFKEKAVQDLDQFKANADLPELDEFDPNSELMDAKDEFEAAQDQEALDDALDGGDDGHDGGGSTTGQLYV